MQMTDNPAGEEYADDTRVEGLSNLHEYKHAMAPNQMAAMFAKGGGGGKQWSLGTRGRHETTGRFIVGRKPVQKAPSASKPHVPGGHAGEKKGGTHIIPSSLWNATKEAVRLGKQSVVAGTMTQPAIEQVNPAGHHMGHGFSYGGMMACGLTHDRQGPQAFHEFIRDGGKAG